MPNIGVPADLLIAGMSADAKNMLQRSMQRNGTERNGTLLQRSELSSGASLSSEK